MARKNQKSRKILLGCIIIGVLLLYMWPNSISFRGRKLQVEPDDLCIDAKLQKYKRDVDSFNVLVNRDNGEHSRQFWPFVGNGYVGVSPSGEEKLHIKHGRALSVTVPFYPKIDVSFEGYSSKDVYVLLLKEGIVEQLKCFDSVILGFFIHDSKNLMDTNRKSRQNDKGPTCVSASIKMYAHRTRPGILVQQIQISNPTDTPMTASIHQIGLSDWQDAHNTAKQATNNKQEQVDYVMSVGTVALPDSTDLVFAVAVAHSKIPDTITVQSGQSWNHHSLIAVKYTELPMTKNAADGEKEKIADLVEKAFVRALNVNSKLLTQEHQQAWLNQWHSGFGISYSMAPGAINGDKINSTLYYAMSNVPAPIHEVDRSEKEKFKLQKSLYFPDRCYSGHHTLQNDAMWRGVDSTAGLVDVVKTWVITLEKNGCASMLQAGSDGILQAMILSLGAFQFANYHLEFNTDPADLHRDYFFRRINYGNNTHVNISVIVGEDNKAVMYASLDKNDKEYYACDAGCLDAPAKLSREMRQFPVKLTAPKTAIMYITADKQHMEELKHVIHVKEIAIAPAHEHHVMALHKHGHHLGGLPTMFWVSIFLLITIFHLFLFKLIYNEYCSSTVDRYARTSKYNI